MFNVRYYSTKSGDWEVACESDDPNVLVEAFDELAGQATVPVLELVHDGAVVLRLGLTVKQTMRLGVLGARMRRWTPAEKTSFMKSRRQGVSAVKKGRNKFLNALVV